ncbi:Lysophospholipase L1 [Flavobacterium flevense]|uniref:Acylneuraminate cytidylyltransferase n=1 Tax=Flavobacterium flevense TaxID=983 RepID=A0A4Y4AZI2_9FLAO|nr:SGNH/GDSL hydrolase family protein [Flavobacterium flevense]GEC72729.1 acylneuraminate cytidylyltransferase [Flavobacterium flevense]SHL91759.1 Lysophospholipase L1 [Flavobacterium flevense]
MQDWPYLSKYQQENASLPLPISDENRVVFLGDSITEFWSTKHAYFSKNKSYINRGISGQTTPQMLVRFRADVVALNPKIVVILAGGNDIAGNTGPATTEMITNNIYSMVELAQVHQIKVILCSVLPANFFYWNPKEKPADQIIALNAVLKEYALAHRISFVDYYSEMADEQKGLQKQLSEDGVHPNSAGYEIMSPLIEKAIQEIINRTVC